jgi:pyrroline-5-carboxylate reductase
MTVPDRRIRLKTEELRIGFLGGGQMAQALARGFVAARLVSPGQVTVCDPDPEARARFGLVVPGCRATDDPAFAVRETRLVVLAVKPQVFARMMLPEFPGSCCVLSVMAGVDIARLQRRTGTARLIRAMPNTPALIGCAATAWSAGPAADDGDRALVQTLLESAGMAVEVEERLLDVVTGLSGSGPAWVFRLVEAMVASGIAGGLAPEQAHRLTVQTVLGAARMLETTGESPAALRERVTSPGGTTAAGLRVLDERGFDSVIGEVISAATRRAAELGRDNS